MSEQLLAIWMIVRDVIPTNDSMTKTYAGS